MHLDSEYRNRWEFFYLADGTIEDSRLKNWREVAWDQVIKVEACLLGHIHFVENDGLGFKTFMNFRWAGREAMFDNGKYIGHQPIKIWTIGWTDGKLCFLKDICFYTGQLLKEYQEALSAFKRHLHPAVIERLSSNE